jgi:MoaA/NifB/PqqE/SkfB family radical SAM enzyme
MANSRPTIISGWRYSMIRAAMAVNIIYLAFLRFRNPFKVVKVMSRLRERAIENEFVFPRCIRNGNKFHGNLSMQGWPSAAFNRYINYSFDQVTGEDSSLHLAIFSITHSCGFQCQHCLEWDRLNKLEDLSIDQILTVIRNLHQRGVSQIMFSGGEPMTRAKDLEEIMARSPEGIEFWTFTNGFTVTPEKAFQLKNSGLTGMIISIDHPDAEQHDRFRGIAGSHARALKAIEYAQEAGLIAALSCCATNDFVTEQTVRNYLEMARDKGVAFIQFLEPKAVGRYSGKRVELSRDKQLILERIYREINFSPRSVSYPLLTYIDYHERTHGCVAHGNNLLYVDAEGYAQNCPFCRGKKFSLLHEDVARYLLDMKHSACGLFETIIEKPARPKTADV